MSSEILFLVNYNSEFNGIYSNMNKAIISILSQVENKDITNFNIETIYNNSNLREKTYYFKIEDNYYFLYNFTTKFSNKILDSYNIEFNSCFDKEKNINLKLNSDEEKELEQIKATENDLQHKINLLKKDKEKLEEMKSVYEVDLKLYYKFKKELNDNEEFTIPEMYVQKYKIFRELEENDSISWDHFYEKYKPEEMNHSYNSLFYYEGVNDTTDSDDSSYSSN